MHMRAQARASMQMVATLKPFPPPWEQTFFGQAKVQFGELERCFLSAFSPAFLARFLVRTRKHTGDRWHCSMHFLLFCVLSVRAAMPPASTAASTLLQPLLYCSPGGRLIAELALIGWTQVEFVETTWTRPKGCAVYLYRLVSAPGAARDAARVTLACVPRGLRLPLEEEEERS